MYEIGRISVACSSYPVRLNKRAYCMCVQRSIGKLLYRDGNNTIIIRFVLYYIVIDEAARAPR